MTLALTGPRDVRDAKRLAELEVVIEGGIQSFVAVGEALLEVRDSRLYRTGYETFEAYCKGRWQFTDRRARQLMEATEAVKALPTGTVVPVNEAQARELAPVVTDLGPEAAAEVMAEASRDGPATAKTIREAARPRLEPADPILVARAATAPVTDYIEQMPPELAAEEREFRLRARWSTLIHRGTDSLLTVKPEDFIALLDAEEREDTERLLPLIESWIERTRRLLAETSSLRVIGGSR